MLNEAGIITGMEMDADYEITFYAGTKYMKTTVKADTHFYQSYEAYKLNDYNITKNGYISIDLPEDLKCGYYRIAGNKGGFFKYYDFKKGESDIAAVDYNQPYYNSAEDQLAAFSQQFVFNLDATTSNMTVHAEFDASTVTSSTEKIQMMLTSPDGKKITVDTTKDSSTIDCDMIESIAGEWIVNIAPQSMKVTNIEIVSNNPEQEATKENYTLSFSEPLTGVVFTMEYQGEGEVTAQVVTEDNKSYDMVLEKDATSSVTHKMNYGFAYLPAGTYQVYVYHHPDTKILDVSYYLSEETRDIEIIQSEQ